MTQHTEKWKWDSNVCDYDPANDAPWLVTDDAKEVRILHGEIKCRSEADARLIAAAPMLLEALKAVYVTCDWHTEDGLEAMKLAKAAIAAATGEQHG